MSIIAFAKHAAFALLVGTTLTGTANAQAVRDTVSRNRWEFMMSSGALVGTGAQRGVIKDAPLSTAQVSYVIGSRFAVTATTGWARSRDIASSGNPKLDVFTYDVGAELRAPRQNAESKIAFTPLVGAGVGARSYNYRNLDVGASHNLATYAALGGEMGVRRVLLRFEVRDYVTRFAPLVGDGGSTTRNDLVAMLGLRLVRRGS